MLFMIIVNGLVNCGKVVRLLHNMVKITGICT